MFSVRWRICKEYEILQTIHGLCNLNYKKIFSECFETLIKLHFFRNWYSSFEVLKDFLRSQKQKDLCWITLLHFHFVIKSHETIQTYEKKKKTVSEVYLFPKKIDFISGKEKILSNNFKDE